jgi:hypothetical protein
MAVRGVGSQRKGKNFEREVRKLAESYGLDVEWAGENQRGKGYTGADLLIAGLRVECKARNNIPIMHWTQPTKAAAEPSMFLFDALEGHDAVVLHRRNCETLVVVHRDGVYIHMPLERWLRSLA